MRRLHRAIYQPDAEPPPTTWLSLGSPRPALIQIPDQSIVDRRLNEHFAGTWAWAIRHPVFRVLTDDPNFGRAWKAFQGRRHYALDFGKPKDHRAACLFVWTVVLWLGMFPLARGGRVFRTGPAAMGTRTREQTRRAARRMLTLMKAGSEPSDVERAQRMRAELQQFEHELANLPRKTYMTRQHDEREWLRHLARWLRLTTASVKPAVLTNLAAIVGFSVDPGTVKRSIQWADEPSVKSQGAA